LNSRLASAGSESGAAESHGMFCGLLCGGASDPHRLWLGELLHGMDPADLSVRDCAQGLAVVADATRQEIDAPGFAFPLMLPDDERPLADRVEALASWVQGFLYGFGLTGSAENRLSPEAAEALGDLAQVAQLDFAAELGGESDEGAYAELVEFARVAAMLIREDCTHAEAPDR